jgi:hypothetical protein
MSPPNSFKVTRAGNHQMVLPCSGHATLADLFGRGTVRADGRKIHPMYLVEVKTPTESKGPWDYYKVRATIPADEAFRPLSEGGCPLVNR